MAEEKRPRSVEQWRKRRAAAQMICATRCPKHGSNWRDTGKGIDHYMPGFCERKNSHVGMHTHELRQGMKDFDERDPSKGCAWDDQPHAPRHRRPASVEKGPLDGFA